MSAFYYVYYDRRAISLVIGDDGIGHYSSTRATISLWLDLDARWQPVDALTLSLGAEWIDATYSETTADGRTSRASRPGAVPVGNARRERLDVGWAGKLDPSGSTRTAVSRVATRNPICRAPPASPNFKVGEMKAHRRASPMVEQDDRWAVAVFVTNLFDDQVSRGSTDADTPGAVRRSCFAVGSGVARRFLRIRT
jgi:hypothetical protein